MATMATDINLVQTVLYPNRVSIPFNETGRNTHSEDKAWMQGTLMGQLVDILDFASEQGELEGQSGSITKGPSSAPVANRHKTVVSRVEFFGLTARAVCSVALHLLKSAVFCAIHGVTLGRFKSEWFKDRIAMEFTGVEVGVQVIQRVAIGVVKPEKALKNSAKLLEARGLDRTPRFNRMFTKNLVPSDASDRRRVAQRESKTQINLTHIAALHATDGASKKKFETGARYATNLIYSVAALVWNAFTMAIYGIAYVATGSNKALKERLEVTKELIVSVTLQSIVESAKGVFNPTKTAEARLHKLEQVMVSLPPFGGHPLHGMAASASSSPSAPPAPPALEVTVLTGKDREDVTSYKEHVVNGQLPGGYEVGFATPGFDEEY